MKINFTKMHGIGNDYIYINCFEKEPLNVPELSIKMSPRHFSVGADGVVLICRSDIADAKMRMFNADGSEGKMCGNAIRCIGKYLYDNKITDKKHLTIETLSGIKILDLVTENEKVTQVSVNMGKASIEPKEIPVIAEEPMISAPLTVNGKEYKATCVSMGNPHCVVYCDNVDGLDLEKIGPDFENNSRFPERVNTEFVRIDARNEMTMRVWERGSGETWACGTGACAVAVSGVLNGLCDKNVPITVHLRGGNLKITVLDDLTVIMQGPATKVYDGVFDDEN